MKRIFYIVILLAGCKEVYNPTLDNHNLNYLVVEGNIFPGDSTYIRLSRSVPVNDSSVVYPETYATVSVESEDGSETYTLEDQLNGFYFSPFLPLNSPKQYRLHIFAADGKEYASDYVPVKVTPPIDSISWKLDASGGVTIYANSHDASNTTQYYRWEYVETWEHNPKYFSQLVYDASVGGVRQRRPDEQIYRCWNTNTSSDILLASTVGLSGDVVHEKPLIAIPYGSEKIDNVYSILVTQYALTKGAYEFWNNLKKNTEQLGSIFDPQPFADYGNIHCISNSSEPVLGYVTACTVVQQRIFIHWTDVQWPYSYPSCNDTLVTGSHISQLFSGTEYLPVQYDPSYPPGTAVDGALKDCVDCRLHGGSTVKPPYMP
ncbi:MAG TPA: DUF4249 domain-containing protein [Parafilimonas sp.]|nr:DUF4249 domain-containing protein [Parafilimonas sp.]